MCDHPTGLELRTLDAVKCHQTVYRLRDQQIEQSYGFFEASIKVANISGVSNAFWLSEDAFEIDIAEVHFPNDLHMTLHNWATSAGTGVGFDSNFSGDLSKEFHDFGILWTPTDIVFEVDGEPVAAIATHGAITKPVDIRFSTALAFFAGKAPDKPSGHSMYVRSLRVYPLQGSTDIP
jgi:beta-glucanase (GH16 family)